MKIILSYIICVLLLLGLQRCNNNDTNSGFACITITSKNIYDGTPLNGAQYRLMTTQNDLIGIYTLSSSTLNIKDLIPGEYIIEEIHPPKNYISEKKQIKTQVSNSDCKEIIFLYTNQTKIELPQTQKLKFYNSSGDVLLGEYNAVRIGEYYWVNQNFYHIIDQGNGFENNIPITQDILNKYLESIYINIDYFQLTNISDFEKYYGRYYSYPSIDYMNNYCYMGNEYGYKIDGWRLPTPNDYRQLFAMCPFNTSYDPPHTTLNERDVRFALGTKERDNPLAFNITQGNDNPYKVYWFNNQDDSNIYGFNMMPGGSRLNGDGIWCNGGCHDGKWGDIYHLFYTANFAVQNSNGSFGAAMIHDHIETKEFETYHYLNVRWCRPLSDLELGYRLYINSEQTDIAKIELDDSPPDGYSELPHGYLRGFYVQYILDKINPSVSIQELIEYSLTVEDNINS